MAVRETAALVVMLAGCVPPAAMDDGGKLPHAEDGLTPVAADEAPPPTPGLTLTGPPVAARGSTISLTLTLPSQAPAAARNGASVFFPTTTGGLGTGFCGGPLGTDCLDIQGSIDLRGPVFTSGGQAVLEYDVPSNFAGSALYVQGVILGTNRAFLSNPLEVPAVTPPPAGPQVMGEASAGHRRPTWSWYPVVDAQEYRARVDGGPWTLLGPLASQYRAVTDLSNGLHQFEVQAGDGSGVNWSPSSVFDTVVEFFEVEGFWDGTARQMSTSPQGHVAAVSCHNCYEDDAGSWLGNYTGTISAVDAAVAAGADLIELDIKIQDGVWYVGHDDDGSTDGATLDQVLLTSSLQDIDQPLFIEIKETVASAAQAQDLLEILVNRGYMVNGRPVVLRAFSTKVDNLEFVRQIIDSGAYPHHEHYLRYSIIYSNSAASSVGGFQGLIQAAALDGYDMVEFNLYRESLFGLLTYARSLGLGTNLWTVPVSMGEVQCAVFRNEVDAITTDYPVDLCAEVVEEDTSLLYLNPWNELGGSSQIPYYRTDDTPYWLSLGGGPSLVFEPAGEDRYGSYLDFDAASGDTLATWDADTAAGEGYLAAMVVNFDQLNVPSGDTICLLSKTDAGGFGLEIHGQATGDVLRFAVHVNGSYHYATYPMSQLNDTDSYLIVGAYDGRGAVRLFVDGSTSGTSASSSLVGGVTNNDSPIRLAADPQGATSYRWNADAKIQMVSVQRWRDH